MRSLKWTLGRMAMVAVAALLIGSGLAAPAEARQQRPEAELANEFILQCFRDGGNPRPINFDDGVLVICEGLPGVGDYLCWFSGGSMDCWIRGTRLQGKEAAVPEPGGSYALEPVAEEPAPVSPPVVTAASNTQADEQVQEPKQKKKQAKKPKKAKKGNGKGKAKQRGKGRGGR